MARTFDPFRDFDRLFGEVSRSTQQGLAMDLYRTGDHFVAEFDLPGIDPSSIDIDIDDRTLTVRAERGSSAGGNGDDVQWLVRERITGAVARQLSLGRGLDSNKIEADYTNGVLKVVIPVAEESKPRKISVAHTGGSKQIEGETIEGQTDEDQSNGS